MSIANRNNFYMGTRANFISAEAPKREPDFISSSSYWYTKEGVYRESDHFCERVSSCSWLLDGEEYCGRLHTDVKTGFCKWEDFTTKDLELLIYSNNQFQESIKIDFDMMSFGSVLFNGEKIQFTGKSTAYIK